MHQNRPKDPVNSYLLMKQKGYGFEEIQILLEAAPIPQNFFQRVCLLLDIGFNLQDVLQFHSAGCVPEFYVSRLEELLYPKYKILYLKAPSGILSNGQNYDFEIQLDGSDEAAFIINGNYHFLSRDKNVFSGSITAEPGLLYLAVKNPARGYECFDKFMSFQVQDFLAIPFDQQKVEPENEKRKKTEKGRVRDFEKRDKDNFMVKIKL